MKTVEILAEEHRLLTRVLTCLEWLLEETAECDSLDAEVAAKIIDYLEHYADACHQDKEEEVLFPRLIQSAPAERGGFFRELLGDHESEREQLRDLRQSLQSAVDGDSLSRDIFVLRARAYVDLQRFHIQQEDQILLPLAEEYLGRADDAEMLVDFRRIERRHFGPEPCDPQEVVDAIGELLGTGGRNVPIPSQPRAETAHGGLSMARGPRSSRRSSGPSALPTA